MEKKKLNKMLIEYYDDKLSWGLRAYGASELIEGIKRSGKIKKTSLIPCLIESFK